MQLINDRLMKAQLRDGLKYWLYIPAAVILGGLFADRIFELPSYSPDMTVIASAVLLIIAGTAFIQRSTKDLALYGDGTPSPLRPPKRLVVDGSYRLCRHPMFFGYDLAALGVVMLFRSWGMLLVSYPLFLLLEYRFLKGEELRLEKRFGNDFIEYRKHAGFLIPRMNRERKTL